MRSIAISLTLVAALIALADTARASDPTGVYALVTEVELEPNASQPDRIRISGAFAVAAARRGGTYHTPRWGRLHFEITAGKEETCRAEWADLAKSAGSGQVISFGSRYGETVPRILAEGDRDGPSQAWTTGIGLHRTRNVDYGPARMLRTLPKPASPAGGQVVPYTRDRQRGMAVILVAKNALDEREGTRYVFTVRTASGDVLASAPQEPGEGSTSFTVYLPLEPGEKVEWSVHVVQPGLEAAAVASASFTVGPKAE